MGAMAVWVKLGSKTNVLPFWGSPEPRHARAGGRAQEGISFPFKRFNGKPVAPAAVLLTHVCSQWRRTALSSPELWINISLKMNNRNFLPSALEFLSRVRGLAMNVKLTVKLFHHHGYGLPAGDPGFDFGDAVYQLFSNRIIQKLHLKIDTHGLRAMSLVWAHSTMFETWICGSLTTLYYFRYSVKAVSHLSSVSFTADRAQGET